MNFNIGARHVGKPSPCLIVAEIGLAHEGSVAQAHAYVDAVKRSGADAIKFQCHLGDTTDQWRVEPKYSQDKDRQAYWQRTSFTPEQWRTLADHCFDVDLIFLCSPFSLEAVLFLNPLVDCWKVPSGKVTDVDMLDGIGMTGKPVLLSTGMSTSLEACYALRRLEGHGCPVGLLQCTSMYPCPPTAVGLRTAQDYRGLSDHSGTIYTGIAVAALGCDVLEVHVCWSKDMGGFDTSSSITVGQLGELVRGVRFVEQAMMSMDKDGLAHNLKDTRRVFMNA